MSLKAIKPDSVCPV